MYYIEPYWGYCKLHNRAVARFENPERGAYSNVVGIMCPPVEIGLTDLPKTEEGMCPKQGDDPVVT